jgi:RimJ/RimL family protein N-acetyltransferase
MVRGRRLGLKEVTRADAQLLADWLGDEDFAGPFLDVWSVTAKQWEQMLSVPWPAAEAGMFLIRDSVTDEPLGLTGYFNPFTRPDLYKGLELWVQVHPRFRERGLAVETACLLVNHLFSTLDVTRLQAFITVGHDVSCRGAEAVGLQREGVCRGITSIRGHRADMYLYSLLRSDWVSEEVYRRNRHPF